MAPAPSSDGRRPFRIRVGSELQIRAVDLELPMELRDLGPGGFAVICERPFDVGQEHRFMISAPERGLSVTINAKAVHGRATADSAPQRYVSGWQFWHLTENEQDAVRIIVKVAAHRDDRP